MPSHRYITNQKVGDEQPLNQSFVRKVRNFINNFTVIGGTFSFDGTTPKLIISRPRPAAAKLAIPCVTTGAPADGVYPVDLHADGKNEASTGTGELELMSVHIGEELPTGTWVMGFEATVIVTGGS